MKVVLAPDKFAGTLTAAEAAQAMALGWRRERADDLIVAAPMADGGEGTLDVVASAVTGAERRGAEVADARGRAVAAYWLLLPDGRALVESAQACGLSRLSLEERQPRVTTSFGVGQLVLAAIAGGATQVVVGLGGSATVDGGAGAGAALGHRLLREDGNGLKVGAQFLVDLARIQPAPPVAVPVVAAVDVANPLLGPLGAVPVFAPQKGAEPQDLPALEAALARLADVAERDLPAGPWRDLPGSGAAGGLGFGLAAFAGASIAGGAAAVASLVSLDEALQGAGAVVTGEGSLDAQTAQGKVPVFVAACARTVGAKVGVVAGRVSDGMEQEFDAVEALGADGAQRAAELVEARTAALARRLGADEP